MNLAQIINLPRYSDVPVDPNRQNLSVVDRFMTLFSPDTPGSSLGKLISRVILFAIIAAGLFFFFQLIFSGYQYLTSGGDSAKVQAASKQLTNATIGLLIVVTSYFLAQIIEVVFGINFLT
jgi:hypothetical protein